MKNNKKASKEVGFAIIAMAVLLLFGSILVDDETYTTKEDYFKSKDRPNEYGDELPEESYLFYLNETDIGRQKKVTQSFPNIKVGSKVENNIIYIDNNFQLNANPFSQNNYSFNVNFAEPENVDSLLLYFTPNRKGGEQNLKIYADSELVYDNMARNSEIPLIINKKPDNKSTMKLTFELEKPVWYSIFNWNKMQIEELKVMEVSRDKSNNIKDFSFQINKEFLERVEFNIVISCKDSPDTNKPIKVDVNGYSIADYNPDCTSYSNRITREIPLNILDVENNQLTIESQGYYTLTYSLNKIYFNDQQTYKFTVSNFNDVIDVIMYGDFDKESIELRINQQTMTLRRDEIKSIIPFLRFGTNEIKIITKPIEIRELIIEKNDFYY